MEGEAEKIKALFRKYDRSGDGFIEADELEAVLRILGGFAKSEIGAVFARMDRDQDGRISTEEFVNWITHDVVDRTSSGTKPDSARLHDDQSAYAGTHMKRGSSHPVSGSVRGGAASPERDGASPLRRRSVILSTGSPRREAGEGPRATRRREEGPERGGAGEAPMRPTLSSPAPLGQRAPPPGGRRMSDPAASAARLRDDAGAYTAGARRRGGPEVGAAGSEAQMPRTPSAARPDSQRSSAEPPLIRVVAEASPRMELPRIVIRQVP